MEVRHNLAKNPRKAFDHDMKNFIREQKEQGNPVLLLFDANSGHSEKDIKDFQRETGVINIFTQLHPLSTPPCTYDRGRLCINLALGCEEAIKLVDKIGYLPFYALTPDDHRVLFLDLILSYLQSLSICDNNTFTQITTPSIQKPAQVHAFLAGTNR